MKKVAKTVNKFSQSHKNLRKFLRLVSYGCYHRKLFARYGINARSYDDFLRQMRFFIQQENIQITWHDKCAYFTFVGDYHKSANNYLYESFLLKTILPHHCLIDITILQLTDKAQSLPQLLEKVSDLIFDWDTEILESDSDLQQTIRRRLNALVNSGVLQRSKSGNKIHYQKIHNPLADLSHEELDILNTAADFYKNYSMLETAGYFLCDSIKNLCHSPSPAQMFQFKNNNFVHILEDDILLKILTALQSHKKILVVRDKKSDLQVTPLAIETDFLHSRQYLFAHSGKETFRLRLDQIADINILTEDAQSYSPPPTKLRPIRLCVYFQNAAEKMLRESLLREEFDIKIVSAEDGFFICEIYVTDYLQCYPKLWKYQTWAEILPGVDGLRDRMKQDALEALKNYAQPF